MIIDLNGELIEAEQAQVSPFDAGYQYGDGVFDTMRTYRGFAYQLGDHLRRLARDADLLQIRCDLELDRWQRRIAALLAANSLTEVDARVRIQISRGGAASVDLRRAEPETFTPVEFVTAQAVGEEVARWQQSGIGVLSLQSSFARGNFPQLKTLNYLPSLMALRFAWAQGYQEALLLSRQSKVLEAASSNIFIVNDGALRTPPARLGLLAGLTRGKVLELAARLGMICDESAFELRDLLLADEVLLTASVKEIVPVVKVDHSAIGGGAPGPYTKALQQAYRREVAGAAGEAPPSASAAAAGEA